MSAGSVPSFLSYEAVLVRRDASCYRRADAEGIDVGFMKFFSSEGKEQRSIERAGKKLMNKYHQTAERKRAIEILAGVGTEEAVVMLLKRYQYRTEATIVDEDEKEVVFLECVELGHRAVAGCKSYIETETGIYWPVKALRKIVGDEETTTHLLAVIDGIEDTFGVNRARLEELVDNLRAFAHDDRVYDRLVLFLENEDEEIVIRAVDGLSTRLDDPSVCAQVVPLLLDEDRSPRVRTMILELMIEQQWNVKRHKKQLTDHLPDNYWIDDTGVVRRK
jgi:hypothetical protein